MKRYTFLAGTLSAFILVGLAARAAFALWLEVPVTKNGVYDGHLFTVSVSDAEAFKLVKVTVAPHPKAVSPFVSSRLGLIAGDRWVAQVPVSEERAEGTVTYSFRVAPEAVAQSYFEIHASLYAPAAGDSGPFRTAVLGKQKVEQLMGGIVFTLRLKDFVPAGANRSDP
jgi:hypothetical protein